MKIRRVIWSVVGVVVAYGAVFFVAAILEDAKKPPVTVAFPPPWTSPPTTAQSPTTVTTLPPPAWLVAALNDLEFPPSRAPEWIDNFFWGSATWSEIDPGGNVVTWTDQPFTLSIETTDRSAYDSVRRFFSCATSPWAKPKDPIDEALDYLDRLEQAALGGSFGAVLAAVTEPEVPQFPLLAPANCRLFVSDWMVLQGADWGFPVERFAYSFTDDGFGDYDIVISENRIDSGRVQAQGRVCDGAASEFHIERVGWIAETGGTVIQGEWTEWPECRRLDAPIEGVTCESLVVRVDLGFVSDSLEEHREFRGTRVKEILENVGYEVQGSLEDEIVTRCDFATRGRFFAFSLPTDLAALPAGVSAYEVRRLLTATTFVRNGAASQFGSVSDAEIEAGFIEFVAEIRKEALTWIVRNMPVYDAGSGTWSSFESFAIGLGHDSGVPPDSRLARDPVGTATDLAFGTATTDDMINWLGLSNP